MNDENYYKLNNNWNVNWPLWLNQKQLTVRSWKLNYQCVWVRTESYKLSTNYILKNQPNYNCKHFSLVFHDCDQNWWSNPVSELSCQMIDCDSIISVPSRAMRALNLLTSHSWIVMKPSPISPWVVQTAGTFIRQSTFYWVLEKFVDKVRDAI